MFGRPAIEPVDPYPIIDRGRRARDLIDNETLREALTAMEEDATARWQASPSRDTEGREVLYHHMQAILELRVTLESWAEAAMSEAAKLDKIEQRKARKATS